MPGVVIIVTGFCRRWPAGMTAETDGPPGALLLARALWRWESTCCWFRDRYALPLLEAGCDDLGLGRAMVHEMPIEEHATDDALPASDRWCETFFAGPALGATHLVAIERPGPSHTPASLAPSRGLVRRRPNDSSGRCPRPISIAATTCAASGSTAQWPKPSGCLPDPAPSGADHDDRHRRRRKRNRHGIDRLGSAASRHSAAPRPAGSLARVACDHLLLAGVSDWGAYAPGTGHRGAARRGG